MMGAIAPTTRKPPKPRAGGIVRPPEDPDSVRGKVYECGPHLVVCGDSLDLELLGMVVTPGSVGLMVLDPPYAIFGSATGVSSSVADDKMIRPMFERTCAAINQTLRTFGQAYICCDWRSVATIMEAARGFGQLEHVNTLIWDKQQGGLGSNWGNSYEELVYLMKRPPARTMKSSTKDTGVRMIGQSNVLRHTRPQGYDRLHNAAKSVPLFEQVIEAATDPGDLVVDLFGGSGTTMIAAANLGRRAVVFELDRGWCDVIRMRWRMYAEEHGYEPGAGALAGELTRASSSD
jgi:DNA modification methylase